MKRSEMILNIVKDSDDKYNENSVNEILFLLESYGMQPPPILKDENTWYRSTGDYGYYVNEWESENDN